MSIFDSNAIWRKTLQPAYYNNCRFHMQTGTMESGRRQVLHQFPKQNVPYAEDMGQQAHTFTIRGYIIMYPYDVQGFPLYQNDFRIPRDQLIAQLETEGPGQLQMPTQKDIKIVVPVRYRLTEEERYGGYCVIDMTFMDAGIQPSQLAALIATSIALQQAQQNLMQQNERALSTPSPSSGNQQSINV